MILIIFFIEQKFLIFFKYLLLINSIMTKDSKNNTAKVFNGILRKECKEGGVLILPNDQEFNLTLENLNPVYNKL